MGRHAGGRRGGERERGGEPRHRYQHRDEGAVAGIQGVAREQEELVERMEELETALQARRTG